MLNSIETLEEGFKRISEETKGNCKSELEEIRQAIFLLLKYEKSFVECRKNSKVDNANSLLEKSFVEVIRLSGQILFLVTNGLYKNAYDSIRYIVESGVQSLYLDQNHPKSSIVTKIEIWKEIENAREYHAQNLISKLDLGELKEERKKLELAYKRLSQKIHFGHKQVLCTINDVLEHKGIPSKVDKEEIIQVILSFYSSLDIFLLLMIVRFPEVKEKLENNQAFVEFVQEKDFPILKRIFSKK